MNESGPVRVVEPPYSKREKQRIYRGKVRRLLASSARRAVNEQVKVDWYTKRLAVTNDAMLFSDSAIDVAERHGILPQEVYSIRDTVRREPR